MRISIQSLASLLAPAAITLMFAACTTTDDPDGSVDASLDGSVNLDAGEGVDAGALDTGASSDAGAADLGAEDSGTNDAAAGDTGLADSGAGDAGSPTDAGMIVVNATRFGQVRVVNTDRVVMKGGMTVNLRSHSASAYFGEADGPRATQMGECLLNFTPGGPSVNVTRSSAGVVSVTGGAQPVTLTPETTPEGLEYDSVYDSSLLWTGGELLSFSAAGATVPAFSGAVPAPIGFEPTGVDGAAWPSPAANPVDLDPNSDHTFTWPAQVSGEVEIRFQPAMYGGGHCYFDASSGSATIPAAVFQAMSQIDGIDVRHVERRPVRAGDYDVDLILVQDTGAFRSFRLQ